jgi:hypothetical protein
VRRFDKANAFSSLWSPFAMVSLRAKDNAAHTDRPGTLTGRIPAVCTRNGAHRARGVPTACPMEQLPAAMMRNPHGEPDRWAAQRTASSARTSTHSQADSPAPLRRAAHVQHRAVESALRRSLTVSQRPTPPRVYGRLALVRGPRLVVEMGVRGGSNRRLSAFQGFRRHSDQDLVGTTTTQLTGIGAGQWAYTVIIAIVPPCAT